MVCIVIIYMYLFCILHCGRVIGLNAPEYCKYLCLSVDVHCITKFQMTPET